MKTAILAMETFLLVVLSIATLAVINTGMMSTGQAVGFGVIMTVMIIGLAIEVKRGVWDESNQS